MDFCYHFSQILTNETLRVVLVQSFVKKKTGKVVTEIYRYLSRNL